MTVIQDMIAAARARSDWLHALNCALDRFGISQKMNEEDFVFSPQFVIERNTAFSAAVSNSLWPRTAGTFYHYTSANAATSILSARELRLYWVKKRVAEDEVRPFLESLGYTHPLEIDPATGRPRFVDSLAARLFYMSLTSTALTTGEEQYFWDNFAGRDGARLTFRIDAQAGFLRPMAYGRRLTALAELIREINTTTTSLLGAVFHWEHAPVVCSLYLPAPYHVEKETRLIVPTGWNLPIQQDSRTSDCFVVAPFGPHPRLPLTIELIAAESRSTLPAVPGVTHTRRP